MSATVPRIGTQSSVPGRQVAGLPVFLGVHPHTAHRTRLSLCEQQSVMDMLSKIGQVGRDFCR